MSLNFLSGEQANPAPVQAHDHSSRNRKELTASDTCGCFYCLATFAPEAIQKWINERDQAGQTALCPFCGIDSVIGSASGFPITREFLSEMQAYWFGQRTS